MKLAELLHIMNMNQVVNLYDIDEQGNKGELLVTGQEHEYMADYNQYMDYKVQCFESHSKRQLNVYAREICEEKKLANKEKAEIILEELDKEDMNINYGYIKDIMTAIKKFEE